jgi:hypothetical protein
MRMKSLLSIGGRIVLAGALAAVFFIPSTVLAEMGSSAAQSGKQSSTDKPSGGPQGGDIPSSVQECIKDKGCLSQSASGQTSDQGTTCTSGMACTNPRASCVLGGSKTCHTYDFGGGNCTCACM